MAGVRQAGLEGQGLLICFRSNGFGVELRLRTGNDLVYLYYQLNQICDLILGSLNVDSSACEVSPSA